MHQDYLEMISAIDHHKSSVNSKSAMVLSVADVQSSNIITAQKFFEMNDRYGTRGQDNKSIHKQLKELQADQNFLKKVSVDGKTPTQNKGSTMRKER